MIAGEASITAKICAFTRAHHSLFTKKPLYDDYYAYELLGDNDYSNIKNKIISILNEKAWEIPTLDTWDKFIDELISPIILSRVKYTEEKLKEFAGNSNETVQYVICGAGLDSFVFRNNLKNVKIFELDHPDTHTFKINRIKELGWDIPENASFITIDFEKQNMKDVLLKAGFNPKAKSLFAIMGVTYYLTLDTFSGTLKDISELSENETWVVFDYPDKEILRNGHKYQRMEVLEDITRALGEVMHNGMSFNELADAFADVGFYVSEHVTSQIIQEMYFQKRHDNLRAYEDVSFILAKKQRS